MIVKQKVSWSLAREVNVEGSSDMPALKVSLNRRYPQDDDALYFVHSKF